MRVLFCTARRFPLWQRWLGRLGMLCAAGLFGWVGAEEVTPDISLETGPDPAGGELLQFEEFPTVVSVTRQASASNLSSVPVSVITAQEIHRRGVMTIPQLFEFVPGMDVVKIDRNRTNVGIRGMFGSTQDRILGLVDGQKTAEVISGATNWQAYPLFIEDIKQIEVVRGPSGAAWGANAFYGVINILTKDPKDTQGFLATATADQFGDTYTQARYGGQSGAASWRVSGGYNSHVASNVARDRNTKTDDAGFSVMGDARLVIEADSSTKLTFGLAYLHQELQSPSLIGYNPTDDQNRNAVRGFMRYDFELSEELDTNWTFLYNYADNLLPSGWSSHDREAGVEGQFDYTGLANHTIAFGGSLRHMRADSYRTGAQDWQFIDDPNEEIWAGLFFVDRYQLNSRTWLELQARGDLFKFQQETQKGDWSGRAAAIFALDEALNHVFRVSGAKSYRAPTILLRATSLKRIPLPTPPFPPNTFAVNVSPGTRMRTETIWSLEAGYTGRMNQNLNLQVNGYYHRYFKLISAELTGTLGPASFYTTGNIDGAIGMGGELEMEYRLKERNLAARAYYAYAYFRADRPDALLRANPPSPHKAGVGIEWGFAERFDANLWYRYNDQTPGDSGADQSTRMFHQMDLNVLYHFYDGRGELLIGVVDLFNDTAYTTSDIGTIGQPEPTPGRTFVVRGQVNF